MEEKKHVAPTQRSMGKGQEDDDDQVRVYMHARNPYILQPKVRQPIFSLQTLFRFSLFPSIDWHAEKYVSSPYFAHNTRDLRVWNFNHPEEFPR